MNRSSAVYVSAALALVLAAASPARAQYSGDVDPDIRIQQLENQLRTLTGQNEELQYRNRRLEEQVRTLQGGPGAANAVAPTSPPQVSAAVPPPPVRQPPQPQVYDQQASAAPQQPQIVQETPGPAVRRRGDAFDPNQNPNAPGAPRALGGGSLAVPADPQGGRAYGEPLDLGTVSRPGSPQRETISGGLATAPPTQTPRDEFDLGIGYMQRRDYALAEETMRGFAQRHPNDPLTADSQYWLGESYYQRQLYREAAETFLAVTTKFDKSGKAPDSLLRLGQSLAALKEKEAACAALGEVGRKYPRASNGVKQAVDREQKRVKC